MFKGTKWTVERFSIGYVNLSMLQKPVPSGTQFQSIVSKFLKTLSKLAMLHVSLVEQELIGALMNVLPMPDFATERYHLLMFPKDTSHRWRWQPKAEDSSYVHLLPQKRTP
jgi:hypothetical protein